MDPRKPTNSRPEDQLRNHSYDGIQEYDKRLPNWWLFTLYITIAFGIGYWAYFQWFHIGLSNQQRISRDLQQIEAVKLSAMAETQIDDPSLWKMSRNPQFVEAGRTTFNSICASCHRESLRGKDEGGIGADLRREIWIHGGLPTQLVHTVTTGVLAKGMPTWGPILGQRKITEVVAYVLSYHHEGEPMSIEGAPAAK